MLFIELRGCNCWYRNGDAAEDLFCKTRGRTARANPSRNRRRENRVSCVNIVAGTGENARGGSRLRRQLFVKRFSTESFAAAQGTYTPTGVCTVVVFTTRDGKSRVVGGGDDDCTRDVVNLFSSSRLAIRNHQTVKSSWLLFDRGTKKARKRSGR